MWSRRVEGVVEWGVERVEEDVEWGVERVETNYRRRCKR